MQKYNQNSKNVKKHAVESAKKQNTNKPNAHKFHWKSLIHPAIVAAFFLFIALVYLHNLTRDVYSGDIGDIVTAAYAIGVPHPPGYPLITLLGIFFIRLPLSIPPVTKVALISAIASFTGLIIYYKFAYKITKSIFLSILSTSILGFSYLFWLQAEIPEVFGLNSFFVIIILYLTYLFYDKQTDKRLYLLAFFLGLSLTHHHTILFIFPAVAIVLLRNIRFIFGKKKRIFLMLFFGMTGILPYLYVPIAASRNPLINWDNASNIQNFINLILRKDYGGFATGIINQVPVTVKLVHVQAYLKSLITNYSYQIIFLAIIGIISFLRKKPVLITALLIGFLFSGPFYVFYGANMATSSAGFGIIERFYLLSSIVFVFFVPFGLIGIINILDRYLSIQLYSYLLIGYFLIVPYFLFVYNFPKTNLSSTQIGNTLARDTLSSLPKGSILFVSGDTGTFSTWYIHYVLGERNDIHIINQPGVGGNKYLDEEINIYHKKNPTVPLNKVVRNTLTEHMKTNKIYGTHDLRSITMPENSIAIPRGLVYELSLKNKLPTKQQYIDETEKIWKNVHVARRETLKISEQNLIASEIPLYYSNGLSRIGDFLISQYNDAAMAEGYYRRALWIEPGNPNAHSGLALSLLRAYYDCTEAKSEIRKAISLYPIWEYFYVQYYTIALKCHANKADLNKINQEFTSQFGKPIDGVLKKYKI